jgi:hypothetical protein
LLAGVKLLGLNAQDAEDLQLRMVDPFLAGQLDGVIDADKHPDPASALSAAKKERVFHWEFEFPEVFEHGGFSAFVGNPPFIGGRKIREHLGDNYKFALYELFPQSHGNADLCAFFFLKSFSLLKLNGYLGLVATNTISQGETRLTGLEKIISTGGVIFNAENNHPWAGDAAVAVNIIHITKGTTTQSLVLDGKSVSYISSLLVSEESLGEPYRLQENRNKVFQGSIILGTGFIITTQEANKLISQNPKNRNVLFPFLNGKDLNSNPDSSPSRWIINFFDWSLEKAQEYPDCLNILTERVKPERDELIARSKQIHEYDYWKFWDKRLENYELISNLKRVLVTSEVTKYLAFTFVDNGWVYSSNVDVFVISSYSAFAVLQSFLHDAWARTYCSQLETRLKYSPGNGFETFPFPVSFSSLEKIGETYHEERRQTMLARQEGLTATYNRFHNPEEGAGDIVRLRELHVEMDKAVASAYGWDDLSLGHDFHETAQGVRFTVSESARREILSRLLRLNHERWEEEQKSKDEGGGMKDERKKKTVRKKKSKSTDGQMGFEL